jgi:hypothetical protein
MNLAERWFSALTTKKLQRSAHRSVQELAQDIRDWVETWNDNTRPFKPGKPLGRLVAPAGEAKLVGFGRGGHGRKTPSKGALAHPSAS